MLRKGHECGPNDAFILAGTETKQRARSRHSRPLVGSSGSLNDRGTSATRAIARRRTSEAPGRRPPSRHRAPRKVRSASRGRRSRRYERARPLDFQSQADGARRGPTSDQHCGPKARRGSSCRSQLRNTILLLSAQRGLNTSRLRFGRKAACWPRSKSQRVFAENDRTRSLSEVLPTETGLIGTVALRALAFNLAPWSGS